MPKINEVSVNKSHKKLYPYDISNSLTNDLFYKYQSGFMPGHGTEKQLLRHRFFR
jgi:hypothetical protein